MTNVLLPEGLFLLDTNVLSELMRRRPSPAVVAHLESIPEHSLWITDITLAELTFGALQVADPTRSQELQDEIDTRMRPRFEDRILSAGEQTWIIWKELVHAARLRRYTFPQPDLVIACIALQHGLTVVTRDTAPFQEAGVSFVNPWNGTSG